MVIVNGGASASHEQASTWPLNMASAMSVEQHAPRHQGRSSAHDGDEQVSGK